MADVRRPGTAAEDSLRAVFTRTLATIGGCVALGALLGFAHGVLTDDISGSTAVGLYWGALAGGMLGVAAALFGDRWWWPTAREREQA